MSTTPGVENVASDPCEKCGKPVVGYIEKRCCDGRECACLGMPLEPCWCDECWKRHTEEADGRAEFMSVNS